MGTGIISKKVGMSAGSLGYSGVRAIVLVEWKEGDCPSTHVRVLVADRWRPLRRATNVLASL